MGGGSDAGSPLAVFEADDVATKRWQLHDCCTCIISGMVAFVGDCSDAAVGEMSGMRRTWLPLALMLVLAVPMEALA